MNRIKERSGNKKFGISMEGSNGFNSFIFGDTIDELIDGLEILKDGKFINTFVEKYPHLTEEQFVRLDIIMPQTNDAEEICKYACNRKVLSNVMDFEDALIRMDDPWKLLKFAECVKGADIQKLEDAIAESKEYKAIIRFAIEIEGADIEKLEDVIIQSQHPYVIEEFAEQVNGANLLKIKNAYFELKSINQIIDFLIKHQKEQGIIEHEDIEKAEELVIESKEPGYICKFALNVDGVNVKKLQEAIIKTERAEGIYHFAIMTLPGADIDELRKAIYKTKSQFGGYYKDAFKETFGPAPIGYYFSFLKTKK